MTGAMQNSVCHCLNQSSPGTILSLRIRLSLVGGRDVLQAMFFNSCLSQSHLLQQCHRADGFSWLCHAFCCHALDDLCQLLLFFRGAHDVGV